jgi:hypothetical protein
LKDFSEENKGEAKPDGYNKREAALQAQRRKGNVFTGFSKA